MGAYLLLNRWIWKHLPPYLTRFGPMHSYGTFLHTLARLRDSRRQSFGTFFVRNRPELELMRRLSEWKDKGATLKMLVLACSTGAEVYSILWTIRSARPDLRVEMHAADISEEVVRFAQAGIYSLKPGELHDASIFERMTKGEIENMFDREGDQLKIKSWIREGIVWHVGDAGDPRMPNILGSYDLVVANRFLCHMDPPDAERCLCNIARLVESGGYLFVSGIDLDIRTKVAKHLAWEPVADLLEEIHDGDPCLRDDWPCGYTGLEPFNKRRHDWKIRYASVFRIDQKA